MSKVPASLDFTDRDLTVSKINKVQAYEAMHAHIGQQKNLLRDQAKLLQKQLNAITRREELAEKIFHAKYNFVPVMDKVYSLYQMDQIMTLSMIMPNEWTNRSPFGSFVAYVKKLGDGSWEEVLD